MNKDLISKETVLQKINSSTCYESLSEWEKGFAAGVISALDIISSEEPVPNAEIVRHCSECKHFHRQEGSTVTGTCERLRFALDKAPIKMSIDYCSEGDDK